MKKSLSLLLVLCICFCIAGCNKPTRTDSNDSSSMTENIEESALNNESKINDNDKIGTADTTSSEENKTDTTENNINNNKDKTNSSTHNSNAVVNSANSDSQFIIVPHVEGMFKDDAIKILKNAGFNVETKIKRLVTINNVLVEENYVLEQNVPAGHAMINGSTVSIEYSVNEIDMYYTKNSDGTITITHINKFLCDKETGALVIPYQYDGYTVSAIGDPIYSKLVGNIACGGFFDDINGEQTNKVRVPKNVKPNSSAFTYY